MRKKLVALRGQRSRQDVSKDLCVTPQMLGAIERGDRNPSLKLANKIANYYNVPIEDIFFNNKDTKCVFMFQKVRN
ncbi:helix-turn-helix domain-containing protein [Listeria monocytogenes]|nr:helix-turn-helix domain-containing protein [Listeria monocytogenes]